MADDRDQDQYEYDVFISHASEDKESFARPFAAKLQDYGLKVWYDETTLTVGDSLTAKIGEGLARSRFGVVVLSNAFLGKNWPEYELRGLLARQIRGQKVILPIWHNLDIDRLLEYSPPLADLKALNTADGLDHVVLSIVQVVRPDLFRGLLAYTQFRGKVEHEEVQFKDASEFRPAPRRRQRLSDGQMRRARIVCALLGDLAPSSFNRFYDGFLRDLNLEDELQIWERTALIVHLYRIKVACSTKEASILRRFLLFTDPFKMANNITDVQKAALETQMGLDINLLLDIIREINQHPELSDEE